MSLFVVDIIIDWENTTVIKDDVKYRIEKELKKCLYNNVIPEVEVTKVEGVEE